MAWLFKQEDGRGQEMMAWVAQGEWRLHERLLAQDRQEGRVRERRIESRGSRLQHSEGSYNGSREDTPRQGKETLACVWRNGLVRLKS